MLTFGILFIISCFSMYNIYWRTANTRNNRFDFELSYIITAFRQLFVEEDYLFGTVLFFVIDVRVFDFQRFVSHFGSFQFFYQNIDLLLQILLRSLTLLSCRQLLCGGLLPFPSTFEQQYCTAEAWGSCSPLYFDIHVIVGVG